MPRDESTAPTLPSVASLVATYGFAVIPVGYGMCSVPGCCCTARARHPWTYTVGLSAMDLPELVLMGLDPYAAHGAISLVADRRLAGEPVPLDEPFWLDDVRLKVIPVPGEWVLTDFNRMATWFSHYGTMSGGGLRLPEVHQIVYADGKGRFPDEPGCASWLPREQPILRDDPARYPLEPSPARRPRSRRDRRRRR